MKTLINENIMEITWIAARKKELLLSVFAFSEIKDVIPDMAEDFEKNHKGIDWNNDDYYEVIEKYALAHFYGMMKESLESAPSYPDSDGEFFLTENWGPFSKDTSLKLAKKILLREFLLKGEDLNEQ